VWEEARKALAAASWTASRRRFIIVSDIHERETDRRGQQTAERHRPHRGNMTSPFVSSSPEVLLERGYVVDRAGSSDYFAPDAETLQDQGFVESHCFRLVSIDERPNIVGLAFEPAPSRRLPDVKGVLWLDRESYELRSLEYDYTNLPPVLQARETGGGRIEFMPLPTGEWIVHRWVIRIPMSFRTERIDRFDREPRRFPSSFKETGGEVLSVTNSAGQSVYRAEMAELLVTVAGNEDGNAATSGVLVSIENTWFEALSDGLGVARIYAPLNGDYGVVFTTPATEALGYAPASRRVTLQRGNTTTLQIDLPSTREMMEEICDAPVTSDRFRVLVGTVNDSLTGLPVRGAHVTTSWQDIEESPGAFVYRDRYATSSTDDNGYYAICGLEFARPTVLVAEQGGRTSKPLRIAFEQGGVHVGNGFFETPLPYWRQDLIVVSGSRIP
jgi:hypothetical protein